MKHFVCMRTSSRPIPRVMRMMKVANESGFNSRFVGAYREKNLAEFDEWDGMPVKRVGSFYPMLNGSCLFQYVKGVLLYNIGAFNELRKTKPDVVHVSDVESFLASFFYKIIYHCKIIYNIHDNLAQRYPLPKPINFLLNIVEGCVVSVSDVALVPEGFRATSLPTFCQKKLKIVRNTPVDPGFCKPKIFNETDKIKVVFAGWLDSGRGTDTLLRLANDIGNIEVIVAGEGDPELTSKFKAHPRCSFKGFVNHLDVLDLTKEAHFVFAHYSPHRIINRFAAPNKLAEALAVGRPVIINSEAIVSQAVLDNSCGIVTSYADYDALLNNLRRLLDMPEEYEEMCHRARKLFEAEYSWNVAKDTTKNILLTVSRN